MENYLSLYKKVFSEKNEKNIICEVNLPEYLPNVTKIIKISTIPVITEKRSEKDSISFVGHILFSVVYLSDFKDRLKSASFSANFNHEFQTHGISEADNDSAFIDKTVSITDEKAQIITSRKLELSCKATISVTAIAMKKNELPKATDNTDIKRLTDETETVKICKLQDCEFSINENISLEEGMPQIREIVFSECTLCVKSAEISENELHFSGVACFNCFYLGGNGHEDEQYISFSKDIPFSTSTQNGTLNDVPPETFVLCCGNITEVNAVPIQDNYGETGICSVSCNAKISPKLYIPIKSEICKDAFSTKNECECEIKEISYDTLAEKIDENIIVSENVRAALGNITDIVFQSVNITVLSAEYADTIPVFDMKATLKLCGTNEQGMLESINTVFNFKTSAHGRSLLPNRNEKHRFDAYAEVSSCQCKIENGEINCNLNLKLKAAVIAEKSISAITSIKTDDSCEFSRDKSEYVIYYPEKSDTVWSTAKKYKVSPEALLAVNGIKSTECEFGEKRAIVIPRSNV